MVVLLVLLLRCKIVSIALDGAVQIRIFLGPFNSQRYYVIVQSFILWVNAHLEIQYSPKVNIITILRMRKMAIQLISKAKIRIFKLLVRGVKIACQFVAVTQTSPIGPTCVPRGLRFW